MDVFLFIIAALGQTAIPAIIFLRLPIDVPGVLRCLAFSYVPHVDMKLIDDEAKSRQRT